MATHTELEQQRIHRYWRNATPAQRIVYGWLTGEEAPTGKPAHQQRRRQYRKASAARKAERAGHLAA
jgi:hypothetical protein